MMGTMNPGSEFDEIDTSEDDIDAMMASGEPVAILNFSAVWLGEASPLYRVEAASLTAGGSAPFIRSVTPVTITVVTDHGPVSQMSGISGS